MSEYDYDFDAAVGEVKEVFFTFKYGGEGFTASLTPDAGDVLEWMEHGSKTEAIPHLLRTFLGNEDYERMVSLKGNKWPKMEAVVVMLVNKLAEGMSGKA